MKKSRFVSNVANQTDTVQAYDVLVCGGGVVGSTFVASLLEKLSISRSETRKFKIGLIESNTPPSHPTNLIPDLRVYALSPKSVSFLKQINAWGSILQSRSQPYRNMQIWEGSGPGVVNFKGTDMKLSNGELGRICEGTLKSFNIRPKLAF